MADRIVGLDTSVVLRLLTGQPEAQTQRAVKFVEEATAGGSALVVSDIALCEVYYALHWHYGVPKRSALRAILAMLRAGPVRAMSGSPIEDVLQKALSSSAKPGFVDRLIHATYRDTGATMVSFEKAARKLEDCKTL